ncbi:hypothetical protein F4811DRAFT_538000 [Daldinia bambusicola]|nr:hypothetical protein F4811DRAFT_538000 [Daldinia bambusicola]
MIIKRRICAVNEGRLFRTLEGHTDWVNHSGFLADGKYVAAASDDGIIRIWDVAIGEAVAKLAETGILPYWELRFDPRCAEYTITEQGAIYISNSLLTITTTLLKDQATPISPSASD